MGFDVKKAGRKETFIQPSNGGSRTVTPSFVSSLVEERVGLAQYCDRCREVVSFRQFHHAGRLRYLKCVHCEKQYNI